MSGASDEPAFLSLLDHAALTVLARYRDNVAMPIHDGTVSDARALRRVRLVTQARVAPDAGAGQGPGRLVSPGCVSAATTPPRHLSPAAADDPAAGGFSGEGA